MSSFPIRILYINHPEADYGSSFLWHGLCQNQGDLNVYDFPPKHSLHGELHQYALPSIPQGLTAPHPWMPKHERAFGIQEDVNAEEARSKISDLLHEGFFDIVWVDGPRMVALNTFGLLEGAIRDSGVPIVLHDGEDYSQLCRQAINRIKPNFYLKRELKSNVPRNENGMTILPCPFSFPAPVTAQDESIVDAFSFQVNEFEHDVLFMCGNTFPDRQNMANGLHQLQEQEPSYKITVALHPDNNGHSNNIDLLPWDLYMQEIQKSRIGISVRGYGYDTCRYWEVAYSTVLFCDHVDIEIPNPFIDGKTAVMFSSVEECIEKIRYYLSHLEELDKIRVAGKQHLLNYHTCSKRANYILHKVLGI